MVTTKRTRNRETGELVTMTTGRGIKLGNRENTSDFMQIDFVPTWLDEGLAFRIRQPYSGIGDIYIIGVTNQELRDYMDKYNAIGKLERDGKLMDEMTGVWMNGIEDPMESTTTLKFERVERQESDPLILKCETEIDFSKASGDSEDSDFGVQTQMNFSSSTAEDDDSFNFA